MISYGQTRDTNMNVNYAGFSLAIATMSSLWIGKAAKAYNVSILNTSKNFIYTKTSKTAGTSVMAGIL